MILERSLTLFCSAQQCFAEVQKPQLMQYIAHPLLRFSPLCPAQLPEQWAQQEYLLAIQLFNVLPLGRQWVKLSGQDKSAEKGHFCIELRDKGRGSLMRKWDHLITIEESAQGCRYTDRLDVQAGLLTPLVWLFAWFFYRHRQQRWQQLVENRFIYPN